MTSIRFKLFAAVAAVLMLGLGSTTSGAKEKVKLGFIGPLSGGTSANGLGGSNASDLVVRIRNADPNAK